MDLLGEYNFRIEYRRGSENGAADFLSRSPADLDPSIETEVDVRKGDNIEDNLVNMRDEHIRKDMNHLGSNAMKGLRRPNVMI